MHGNLNAKVATNDANLGRVARLTNTGAFGLDSFTAVIPEPSTGLLLGGGFLALGLRRRAHPSPRGVIGL